MPQSGSATHGPAHSSAGKKRAITLSENANVLANKIGDFISKSIGQGAGGATPQQQLRATVKPNVLSRMVDAQKKLQPDKTMNRVFRAAEAAQDELFSTALTREMVSGFGNQELTTTSTFVPLRKLVDLISNARIPTAHSGYALATEKMQHPTSTPTALFTNPKASASNHALMDARRRAYISLAMKESMDDGKTGVAVVVDGVKAAIEFTLNHFTAPVSADDVMPHSLVAAADVHAVSVQDQLRSRELMKKYYVRLGGTLRPATPGETAEQSLRRKWRLGQVTPLSMTDAEVMPPSPRRQLDAAFPV